MKEAVCKNSIASIRFIEKHILQGAKVVHRKGEKTTLWDKTIGSYRLMKEYDDTVINHKGNKYTIKDLSAELMCTIEVDQENVVWISSQLIIHYQNKPWHGSVESKYFKSDEDALNEFNKIVEENNMKIVTENE